MRRLIHSLMTDKKRGPLFYPFKIALYALSLVYGLGIIARQLLYRFGVFKSHKAPLKIISVGNLTLGGTGKTPFVIRLAGILNDKIGDQTAVLIRGYGWDEQAMLKKKLSDAPILVGENRVKQAHRAVKLYGSTTAILDDGFQYWELKRDLDIVLIDSRNPFGNGRLFPRGILRETKGALERADMVVFTKVDPAGTQTLGGAGKKPIDLRNIKEEIKRINPNIVFMETLHSPASIYDVKLRKDADLSFIRGRGVMLLSSIGDPGYFEETVRDLGATVVEHIAFGDHHNYSLGDAALIVKRCNERSFEAILTTEKDAVKLNRMSITFAKIKLLVLCVELVIVSGEELLIDRLHSLYNR